MNGYIKVSLIAPRCNKVLQHRKVPAVVAAGGMRKG